MSPITLRFAEARDGVGGLGPQLGIFGGTTGLAAYEPERASGDCPGGEHHLPFHASTIAAAFPPLDE